MIGSIIIFIVVLSILILIHELGHFYMAKRAGILVEEFGIGIPPKIWGKKFGETEYSINWLPFGGFVRLHGENTEDSITNPKRAFLNKSKKTRISIVLAGVVMNFALAVVAFAIVYSFSGIPKETDQVKVIEVDVDSPAQDARIVPGDIITTIEKIEVHTTDEFIGIMQENADKRVTLEILHEDEVIKKTIKPRKEYPEGQGPLGVTITNTEIYFPPIWQRPFVGIYYGLKESVFWGKEILNSLGGMVKGVFVGQPPKDIAGPVGIYAITSKAASVGILALINFVGILSLNFAILNIVPFPALDGGRLLFIGIESIFGRKVLPKIEAIIHTVGFIFLIVLLILLTVGDVKRLVINGGVDGFLNSFGK